MRSAGAARSLLRVRTAELEVSVVLHELERGSIAWLAERLRRQDEHRRKLV
eukprot:COSAG06_NODE_53023_length_302_cov_1.014778_1_plen_50_part_01